MGPVNSREIYGTRRRDHRHGNGKVRIKHHLKRFGVRVFHPD